MERAPPFLRKASRPPDLILLSLMMVHIVSEERVRLNGAGAGGCMKERSLAVARSEFL
jgi:hypothetical protein